MTLNNTDKGSVLQSIDHENGEYLVRGKSMGLLVK